MVTQSVFQAGVQMAEREPAALQVPSAASLSVRKLSAYRLAFCAIVGLYLVYAGAFIYRTSFVIDGHRYFSLFDDAMIAMRYAHNLAHGYGLVWNPGGERVEGFTDPLWVAFLSLIHFLPLGTSKICLLVQLSAAVILAANLHFVRRIALHVSNNSQTVALSAVILTATYLPLNFWGLQGMEVCVLALIVSISLCWALASATKRQFHLPLYLLLGTRPLVRADMVVPFIAVMLFLAMADPKNRTRHLVWGTLVLLCFSAGQTALRLWYFGELLRIPTT